MQWQYFELHLFGQSWLEILSLYYLKKKCWMTLPHILWSHLTFYKGLDIEWGVWLLSPKMVIFIKFFITYQFFHSIPLNLLYCDLCRRIDIIEKYMILINFSSHCILISQGPGLNSRTCLERVLFGYQREAHIFRIIIFAPDCQKSLVRTVQLWKKKRKKKKKEKKRLQGK